MVAPLPRRSYDGIGALDFGSPEGAIGTGFRRHSVQRAERLSNRSGTRLIEKENNSSPIVCLCLSRTSLGRAQPKGAKQCVFWYL